MMHFVVQNFMRKLIYAALKNWLAIRFTEFATMKAHGFHMPYLPMSSGHAPKVVRRAIPTVRYVLTDTLR